MSVRGHPMVCKRSGRHLVVPFWHHTLGHLVELLMLEKDHWVRVCSTFHSEARARTTVIGGSPRRGRGRLVRSSSGVEARMRIPRTAASSKPLASRAVLGITTLRPGTLANLAMSKH